MAYHDQACMALTTGFMMTGSGASLRIRLREVNDSRDGGALMVAVVGDDVGLVELRYA